VTRPAFTVDTQLFRELGELLVGRDATALSELIKNAYDADATRVEVIGTALGEGVDGAITVRDNGTGMTGAEFRSGYLTIAGRGKEQGDRRSSLYRRRFTGEKGIGRLATHKLARSLHVSSVAAPGGNRRVDARIDWDAIEAYRTLADIGPDALDVHEHGLKQGRPAGTKIELSGLRHSWDVGDLRDFVVELNAFEPPHLLTGPLPDGLLNSKALFQRMLVRDAEDIAGFEVELLGDFDRSEDFWRQVADTASWIVEIDSRPNSVVVAVSPTDRTLGRTSDASGHVIEYRPDAARAQPEFTARILARENARGTRRTRDFVSKIAGIRVYMEGFRVPPYGESGNDWLSVDRAYAKRSARLDLDLPGLPAAPAGGSEGLRGLPNNAYVGAVLLTRRGAPGLEMLINREGFVSSAPLEAIRDTVTTALNILTRIRAQSGVAEGAPDSDGAVLMSSELRVRDGLQAASEQARALRTRIADIGAGALDADIGQLTEDLEELGELADSAVRDRSLLRVLASVGTQMAAFVHETQGLVGAAQGVSSALALLSERYPERHRELSELAQAVNEVASRIEIQARYLSDATTVAARRRRQRLAIAERFDAAAALIAPIAARLGISIENRIDPELRTAPMYPAELTVILSNLLTNAVKAAGAGGRIRGRSTPVKDRSRGLSIRVENTGVAMDAEDAERWFAPFASTTVDTLDPILGQGMGMGLPITRSMVEDYRGSIRFVAPRSRFAAAIELRLP
jgi:signal transduction histidine kinase